MLQECDTIHNRLLTACSRSYLLEHGLKADGRPDTASENAGEGGSFQTFFNETSNGKYVPRSIFVDLDPSVSPSTLPLDTKQVVDMMAAHR